MPNSAYQPLVSVMVVTYNQRHLLPETLESVLSQDYPQLEIVVADDASTDDAQSLLRNYAEQHPGKFRLVLNPQNLGITGNSNAALNACTGELIAVLGGDDLFLPGKISAQVEQFADPRVVLSYHPVDIFLSDTGQTLYTTNQRRRENPESAVEIIECGGIAGASSLMVRRSALPPGGFDARLPVVSDWLFSIEVALQGRVVHLDRVYGKYRKSHTCASNRTYELLAESLRALDLAIEKHPDRPELVDACRRGKARYIAGEAFRQLSQNVATARDLSAQAVYLDPANPRYRVLHAISRATPLVRMVGPLLHRSKYLLKKLA